MTQRWKIMTNRIRHPAVPFWWLTPIFQNKKPTPPPCTEYLPQQSTTTKHQNQGFQHFYHSEDNDNSDGNNSTNSNTINYDYNLRPDHWRRITADDFCSAQIRFEDGTIALLNLNGAAPEFGRFDLGIEFYLGVGGARVSIIIRFKALNFTKTQFITNKHSLFRLTFIWVFSSQRFFIIFLFISAKNKEKMS